MNPIVIMKLQLTKQKFKTVFKLDKVIAGVPYDQITEPRRFNLIPAVINKEVTKINTVKILRIQKTQPPEI